MILTVEEWLGKDNQLGIDIMSNKYIFNNENVEEFIYRVSGGNEELADLICKLIFFFGGRTLANRNTGKKATMMNCYSEGYVEDSMESILEIVNNIALTFKSQGGEGLSLSKIRPKGCGINHGQFKSDGIVPFMELFNQTTASISQGGSRKGALLMSLDAWHKEAPEFVTIKSNEGKIQKANLSLEIDDDFMSDVKKYYDYGEVVTRHIIRDYNDNKVEYDVTPINLYKLMMKQAYDWAEPGCIFTNRFRNYNLMEYCDDYNIVTGNPCFSGNMKLLTKDGYKTFEELSAKNSIYIYNANGNISKSKVWCSGEKETVKINFANGKHIICTPDHRFMTTEGNEVQAKDLARKKVLLCNKINKAYDELYVKLGFIQGDGELSSLNNNYVVVNIGSKDTDIRDLFSDDYTEAVGSKEDRAVRLYGYNDKLLENEFSQEILPKRVLPKKYYEWDKYKKASFLHGCYSANGSVLSNGQRILYKTTCKEFANQLVETLDKDFNISAYITTNKSKTVKFNNGEYACRESYDINIANIESKITFLYEIGFYQYYKKMALENALKLGIYVYSVEPYKNIPVYDFSEPETHWGIVEGCVVHNCGEQPLAAKSACDLGSINLSELVLYPFTARARFDFEMFGKAIDIAIRALDEIIDENKDNHALPEQKEMSLNYRNIGLGTMGMWDMLCKLKLKYGSQESKDFINMLFGYMFRRAVIASSKLAKEKGAFPKYDSNVLKSTIIKRHFTDEELHKLEIDKYGLRNCSLLSIAPNGSIGSMLNISTGCEPIFQISYKRKTESLNGKDSYYDVYTKTAKQYMDLFHTDKLPDYFVSAGDIDWKDRIDIQAIMQDHIDTAISSTINLPNSATIDEIEQLYLYAWEQGLKGVTIFRDGCKRAGILTTDKKKDNNKKENKEDDYKLTVAKSTPKVLPRGYVIKVDNDTIGKERHLNTGCGTLHVCSFFDPTTGDLLEDYVNKGSQGGCFSNLIGLSRMISYAARIGGDVREISDQLLSVPACPAYVSRRATKHDTSKGACCPNAIGYAILDMYNEMQNEINDDTDSENEEELSSASLDDTTNIEDDHTQGTDNIQNPCPQCGAELVFEGGCNVCKSCGWSKCD